MSTEDILNEREKTHGDYLTQSSTAQGLKFLLQNTPNWRNMPPYMRESLELICTKMARMTHGDFWSIQNSEDIAGYAQLIVRELEK